MKIHIFTTHGHPNLSEECKAIYAKAEISTIIEQPDQCNFCKLNPLPQQPNRPVRIKPGQQMRSSIERFTKIYKEKTKKWNDRKILSRQYLPGKNIILFNYRLKLFPRKLKSRWSGPFQVVQESPTRAVTIKSMKYDHEFKVNGQRLKQYMGVQTERDKGSNCFRR
ncbi:hypothetical protein GQ457_02G021820 [Hibiscus cannabinus]